MTLLLALAGAAAAFAIGIAVGRSALARPPAPPIEPPRSAPPPELKPEPEPVSLTVADVLDAHPIGIVIGGADGDVEYRNAAARAMTGTHAGILVDEAVERHLDLGRAGEQADEVIELYGPPKTVFAITSQPLAGGRAVVFVVDISEPRRIERIRTDFVANISHELKTPIGALAVLAETLVDTDDPETVGRVVQRMIGESERASRTIDDLMELSRIELGDERTVEEVKVADVVGKAIDRVTELAKQRGIRIVRSDGETFVVEGDRTQLVSAVGNLVENAVKYSDADGVVRISVTGDEQRVEIAVADQGVGIPQRDLDRIFERFYRVDRARSRVTGGTGLGLSIVRHVATNHGGEVMVTSTEGEGSTFVLRLPADHRGVVAVNEPFRQTGEVA